MTGNCPHCCKPIRLDPELAGRSIVCPLCTKSFRVPSSGEQPDAEAEFPPDPVCPHCGKAAQVAIRSPDEFIRCPHCSKIFRARQGTAAARRAMKSVSGSRESSWSDIAKAPAVGWIVACAAGFGILLAYAVMRVALGLEGAGGIHVQLILWGVIGWLWATIMRAFGSAERKKRKRKDMAAPQVAQHDSIDASPQDLVMEDIVRQASQAKRGAVAVGKRTVEYLRSGDIPSRVREQAKVLLTKAADRVRESPDETHFAAAMKELDSGDAREGLWARCVAEGEGNKQRAHSPYIRYRAAELQADANQQD